MSLIKAFGQQRRAWIVAEMVAALLLIGALEFATGYEIRLFPFYAVPIFVVAWFCDRKSAVLVGLFAGIISLTADWLTGDPDLLGWAKGWEVARHLGSCLAVAFVGCALRAKSDVVTARIALLEHSQQLEREIVDISDAEQRRIGQDLHDGLCQYLAALACSATSLRDDLEKLNLKDEAGAASKLAGLLQNAVVQARDLAHELVPAHVAQVGLVLALESLAESINQLPGIHCRFEFRGMARKHEDREAGHLYRIAQEAINNATKHGSARNILVSFHVEDALTTLQILDDGTGFEETSLNGFGAGLNIMRYRAREAGGELTITHPKSGGTLVRYSAAKNNDKVRQNAAA